MATITSFESLKRPSKSDLKQFAELLEPLFQASSEEARRQATAVLSQCPALPSSVAYFLGSQPINIAAIFLTRSIAIDDATLITIAKTQGVEHARAIGRRENLSPTLVDMLVSLRHPDHRLSHAVTHHDAAEHPSVPLADTQTAMESIESMRLPPSNAAASPKPSADSVRELLRSLVTRSQKKVEPPPPSIIPDVTDVHEALFVRFGRAREPVAFARVMKDVLACDFWLIERVLKDLSGTQLATTMLALGLRFEDISLILRSFYPHLDVMENNQHRSIALLASLDVSECRERLTAWLRADDYTHRTKKAEPAHEPMFAANRASDPRDLRPHPAAPETLVPANVEKTLKAG